MSAKHTPGPWDRRNTADYAEIIEPDGNVLAMVRYQRDAAPIAAAPDMLAALKFVEFEFKAFLNDDPRSRRVRDRIRAAIAKAESAQ